MPSDWHCYDGGESRRSFDAQESFILTGLGLQMFLAYQAFGRPVNAADRRVRLRRLAVCQLAKIASVIFLAGFAAIQPRFDSSGLLTLSFVLLIGIDALGLLIILFAG